MFFAIFGNCIPQPSFVAILKHVLLGRFPVPDRSPKPDQSQSCHHDGRWLDLPQGTGIICYKAAYTIHKARQYTEDTKYVVDNNYADDTTSNNDNIIVKLEKPWSTESVVTLLACIEKAGKLLIEIARFAHESMQSVTAKSRQAAADQMRRAFKNMPFNQQERVSQLLASLHEVLENTARFLERSGARATSTMQWMGIHGEFSKIPGQLLQDTALWLRQYDRDVQDVTTQALVDMIISAAWSSLKI
ncbi:hypothetical protein PG996_001368 [Apiospora saccharicola]|uniref:Uncharacterized protein n=1 Tax=Apiospora saccharicola TaxID=335842 RepID=A0ABR1WGI5_9PEZI